MAGERNLIQLGLLDVFPRLLHLSPVHPLCVGDHYNEFSVQERRPRAVADPTAGELATAPSSESLICC